MNKRKGYYTICIEGTKEKLNGEFICKKASGLFSQSFVDIGGFSDVTKPKLIDGFKGEISSFELYNDNHIKDLTELKFPDVLKDLMIENQKSSVSKSDLLCQELPQKDRNEHPAPKRKKVM